MDESLKMALTSLSPKVSLAVSAVVLALGTLPRLFELWETWRGFRSDKRDLELRKLRYEVEILRRQLSPPGIAGSGPETVSPERGSVSEPAGDGGMKLRAPVAGESEGQKPTADPHLSHLPSQRARPLAKAVQWHWVSWLFAKHPLITRYLLLSLTIAFWIPLLYGIVGFGGGFVVIIGSFFDPKAFSDTGGFLGGLAMLVLGGVISISVIVMMKKLRNQRRLLSATHVAS